LGLATVYGIVKQSGGYIWLDSEVGVGTTFNVYLPCIDEDAQKENEKDEILVPKGQETILIVEDEDMVRSLTSAMLEECGYRVIEARSGVEALEIIKNQNCAVDLVMTDIVMPQMGGRELAERLAADCPDLRMLFTSGYTDDEIVRHEVIKEETNFIQKPFTFDALAHKVRECLDGAT
jgi:CheY-like chemotaxis protein